MALTSSLLPSTYKPFVQPINRYRFFEVLERALGESLSEGERRMFAFCRCVEDFMLVLINSPIFRRIALDGNTLGQSRLIELYTCLRADMRWEPRAGFDLWGALEFYGMIKAGTVEVKSGGVGNSHNWSVQITGRELEIKYDVLVFVGLSHSYNPCDGVMITFPRDVLEPEVRKSLARNKERIPEISISRSSYDKRCGRLNKWYEYELVNHSDLRDFIARQVHGKPTLITYQMALF